MADILIRCMEMPKSGEIFCINISPDGKVTRQLDLSCEQIATAVPLQEGHGRLIDAGGLLRDNHELADCDFIHPKYDTTLRELIVETPTIVPAEGSVNDGT